MYTRLINLWSNFKSSFWFVPSILLSLAVVAAIGLIELDSRHEDAIQRLIPMAKLSPPAARSILSSIVGAMVSTTGVVFSITIVALSLASSQFGSRLIRTYRKRLTTRFTLGIFVATSLFCILVLTSIRENSAYDFVPTLAVSAGILLSVICLVTLVYYIHDMSKAIQAPYVIQSSADDLDDAVKRLFPANIGEEADQEDEEELNGKRRWEEMKSNNQDPDFVVHADRVGYIQAIEDETVMGLANRQNLVVLLLVRPGDFLFPGRPLAKIFRVADADDETKAEDGTESNEEECGRRIKNSLILGSERTHVQDVRHAFNELVDIAVRALSPGINDPFTAINCIDRIHAALLLLTSRKIPSRFRQNDKGELRVVANPVQLRECVAGSLGVIADYANENPIVKKRIDFTMSTLEPVIDSNAMDEG